TVYVPRARRALSPTLCVGLQGLDALRREAVRRQRASLPTRLGRCGRFGHVTRSVLPLRSHAEAWDREHEKNGHSSLNVIHLNHHFIRFCGNFRTFLGFSAIFFLGCVLVTFSGGFALTFSPCLSPHLAHAFPPMI